MSNQLLKFITQTIPSLLLELPLYFFFFVVARQLHIWTAAISTNKPSKVVLFFFFVYFDTIMYTQYLVYFYFISNTEKKKKMKHNRITATNCIFYHKIRKNNDVLENVSEQFFLLLGNYFRLFSKRFQF